MNKLQFDGRVALVTGGARGLGRAYVSLLCERGARVLVVDRPLRPDQPDDLGDLVETVRSSGGTIVPHIADISTRAGAHGAVHAALSAFGRLDVVINNAGILFSHKFADYPEADLDSIIDVHVRGSWHVTQAAWPSLVSSGSGRVVNTVSRAAFFGEPVDIAYSAAKAALYGFTRALAREGESSGVKVNAICPAAWTDMFAGTRKLSEAERALTMEKFKTSFVSPVVLMLAHEQCPCNGEVIASVGGVVQRYLSVQTTGMVVDDSVTPELLMESFDLIADERTSKPIDLASYKPAGSGAGND